MDLVKNLLKSYYFYTLPSDVRCSTNVRPLPDVRHSTTEAFLRMSGTLRMSDTFTTEAFLRTSGPSGRPCSGCPAQLGRPYPVHWVVGHTFHSGWSSDGCRTSGPICASRCPTFSGRPAPPVPQTVSSTHHLYIYTFPFHGIRLTIHFEPLKNTPHSLSHSSTLNPRFPSVLGAFERSSPIK